MFEVFTKLADVVTYDLAGLDRTETFAPVLHFFVEDTAKIFFLMAVMVYAVGFLRTWISQAQIRHWLGRRGAVMPYVVAVCLGAVSPFCSCSSIPLFTAFIRAGVPAGVALAFLVTSPMINEVAAVLFGEALGWKFTIAYVSVGLLTGLIGGVLVDRFGLERWLKPQPETALADENGGTLTYKRRAQIAWAETESVLVGVGPYIIVGVSIGAFIHGYVPQDWLETYVGRDNIWAVPMAVLVGIPLYASCTGMVPVAEALMDKGVPVGTTLTFIMSTVAISLPELLILARLMQTRFLAVFVLYLAVAFILVGYGFNAFF